MEISLKRAYYVVKEIHSHKPTIAGFLTSLGFQSIEFSFADAADRDAKFTRLREYCKENPDDGYAVIIQVSDDEATLFCEDADQLMSMRLIV